MKKWELAVLLGFLLALVLSQFTAFSAACADVRADTLRLHVLANSDSAADQRLKLAVRDAILAKYGAVFAAAQNERDAARIARNNLPGVQALAAKTLRAAGSSADVRVSVERAWFATTQYDGFTLPAGTYEALRVELGAAAGHNWFCVMYPPLCLPAAGGSDGLAVYSPAERGVLESPYTLKFAALEWFEKQDRAFANPDAGAGAAKPLPAGRG